MTTVDVRASSATTTMTGGGMPPVICLSDASATSRSSELTTVVSKTGGLGADRDNGCYDVARRVGYQTLINEVLAQHVRDDVV